MAKELTGWAGVIGAGVFTLLWSAFTLFMDLMLTLDISARGDTLRFVAVEGTVSSCEIKTEDRDDEQRWVDIEYHYLVDNISYSGNQICIGGLRNNAAMSKFVAEHPVGTTVPVYYDPDNPATAVLMPGGWSGQQMLEVLFAIPFTVMMLGLWGGYALSASARF